MRKACPCALQWDAIENKSGVAVYAGGAVVLLWFSSTIIGAINNVPVVCAMLTILGTNGLTAFVASVIWACKLDLLRYPLRPTAAAEADGAGGPWLHRLVCVPLPALQGRVAPLSHIAVPGHCSTSRCS